MNTYATAQSKLNKLVGISKIQYNRNKMKTHLILREKALENFGNKEEFNKAVQKIEKDFCVLSMKPIDFYTKLYNLSLTIKK